EFSHNPPSDAGVYWNIRQSGGWIWANSKTIVAGSGKSDRLLGLDDLGWIEVESREFINVNPLGR
ncbi:MAG: hypothetical protein ACI9MB_004556, partial [Verrucomicrobiales bacterium]